MDAASLFNTANAYFVNEEYEEALKHYTCAIALQDDVAEYLVHRAAAHLKLGHMKEALEDAESALTLSPDHHVALQRKGVSLFYQGDYGLAKQAFEKSLQVKPNAEIARKVWVRKCDAELSGSSLPLQGITAETTLNSAAISTSAAASSGGAPAAPPAAAPAAASSTEAHAPTSASSNKKIRHEWYQSNTHVFITIFQKGMTQDAVTSDFKDRQFSLSMKLPTGDDDTYSLDLDLFDAIEPKASKVEVSKVKVEVQLAKRSIGMQWKDLEKQEPLSGLDMPQYPTSSQVKKDWSKIDRDIEAELKAEKPQGDEALNTLFKEIYDKADDETRRAMNKSFQTSGGTVLSTNWGEVAKADYEGKDRPTPPEGQTWKDWRDKTEADDHVPDHAK